MHAGSPCRHAAASGTAQTCRIAHGIASAASTQQCKTVGEHTAHGTHAEQGPTASATAAPRAHTAGDPNTPMDALWHIARTMPPLRKWVVVNRAADANLLEYISQQGGPGVRQALELVLESLELQRSSMQRMRTS